MPVTQVQNMQQKFNTAIEFSRRRCFHMLWILINILVFLKTYQYYSTEDEYFYLRLILGKGLGIARGSAAVIMINCFLVLLPVCQTLNLLVHKMVSRFLRYIVIHWFNNLEKIHITAAGTIFISSVIHSSAHILNANNFSKHYHSQYPDLNWAVYKNQSTALLILTSVVGITGLAMLLILIMMLLLSQKAIRNVDHEVFGNSHLTLFLIFFILYVIHPTSRVLKKQVNVPRHQPGCEEPSRDMEVSFDSNFLQNNSYIPVSPICQTKPIFHHMDQVHLYLTCQRQLDRFTLEIYLTQETATNLNNFPEKMDFLFERIKFGRPIWHDLLNEWKIYYERGTLPVYICGPKLMEKQVKQVCRDLQRQPYGSKLRCISETFA
ncbi:NADPH oxidase 4 [Nilaparvata lugens]|uniref:NADPH oxidase 4 n=1 Tax=Nilaparvata lugens TaxID=108931 RepID=UPI00193D8ED8|nr:NADPH oxidase 4 [Nilaparvata lugens]